MKRIYLHPLPVRIWHWVNAISFLVLIVTGLQVRYRELLGLMKFRTAVDIHNMFGFILIFNFLLWLVFYILTGKIRIYIPPLDIRKFISGCVHQARYYGYGLFLGEQNPHHSSADNKFNPMQQMAYLAIMMLLIPAQLWYRTTALGRKGLCRLDQYVWRHKDRGYYTCISFPLLHIVSVRTCIPGNAGAYSHRTYKGYVYRIRGG